MNGEGPLARLRAAEALLLARRALPADPEASIAEALAAACDDGVPAGFASVGQAIGAAVAAHGATFGEGCEPPYHDRHHQAEAALCAGWLAGKARRAGLLDARQAGLCVLALAGHDLLHDGSSGGPPGTLERRSAEATDLLAAALTLENRAEIVRLIMLTALEQPPPADLPGRLVREADLFGSFTPCLGWRLSRALARELALAGTPDHACVATHAGRLALLRCLPPMTPPAVALGLEAARAAQIAALRHAACAAAPDEGAALLDALPEEEGRRRWKAALAALGLPALPR